MDVDAPDVGLHHELDRAKVVFTEIATDFWSGNCTKKYTYETLGTGGN
jgi:hypothetical protein